MYPLDGPIEAPAVAAAPATLPPAPPQLATLQAAFALSPAEARLLWILAAPALHLPVLQRLRRRAARGPWPTIEAACARAAGSARAGRALHAGLPDSALLRYGLVAIRSRGARRGARIARDILRALAGRAPVLPAPLRAHAAVLPVGQGWRADRQRRLQAALAQVQRGDARWLCIDADPADGVLDALAALHPVLCLDLPSTPRLTAPDLIAAARVARARDLVLLVRTRRATWPQARRWAGCAPPGLVIERPRGCGARPPTALGFGAESLGARERRAIWAQEIDAVAAATLAVRHRAGRALIHRVVDTVRLRGEPLTVATLDGELRRLLARSGAPQGARSTD